MSRVASFLINLCLVTACGETLLTPIRILEGSAGDSGTSQDSGTSPVLAAIAPGTALDLGEYRCRERLSEGLGNFCTTITAFSRLNYDPYQHRMLMFGGHSGRTDLDGLSLSSLSLLRWRSLYPSMTCAEVMGSEVGPRGFHLSTGHPLARDTYDMNVIANVSGAPHLLMLSTASGAAACRPESRSIRSIARFPLEAALPTWSHGREWVIPWHFSNAAEYDPESGMVVVIGSGRGASFGGLWIYDPSLEEVVSWTGGGEFWPDNGGGAQNLVLYPPTGAMYLIGRRTMDEPAKVRRLDLDRDDWSQSHLTLVSTAGLCTAPDEHHGIRL